MKLYIVVLAPNGQSRAVCEANSMSAPDPSSLKKDPSDSWYIVSGKNERHARFKGYQRWINRYSEGRR
jgi:hypothetical protein